jgi:uncharacterized protein YyaL (SSP411 family)
MLYDNGQLLSVLSYAYLETGRPLFRARIDETVSWLIREMQLPGGGFASSLDADTDHEEGLTYLWSWDELQEVLGSDFEIFAQLYGVTPEGNFEGSNILNRLDAESREWRGEDEELYFAALSDRLLSRRNERAQPARDDKVLADWNGLAITGLAHAARVSVNGPAHNAAVEAFNFVCESMADGHRLAHSWLDGKLVKPGIATDYANMIRAALALFSLKGEAPYLEWAEAWFAAAKRHHFVEVSAAYNLLAYDAPALIAQPLSIADEATPAATGVMAGNAATLFMLTGDASYREHAERLIGHLTTRGGNDIIGAASLQSAFDTLLRGRLGFVIGEGFPANSLIAAALSEADPALLAAEIKPEIIRAGHPAEGKRPSGRGALFLCDAFRCLPEITSADDARETFSRTRSGLR